MDDRGMDDAIANDLAAIARIGAVPIILRTIREVTNLRFTVVARVLPDRWIACAVHDELDLGIGVGSELDITATLCTKVQESGEPIIIEHVEEDPYYCDHAVPKLYGFQSYISVPIYRRNGDYFGNVCGVDPLPRELANQKTLSMMRLFSELISLQLEADEQLYGSRLELDAHREVAELREQFIAILGHDVRNPVSSIMTGAEVLLRKARDPGDRRVLERLRSSTFRIAGLVDDLLDLARGRLCGGITLEPATVADLDVQLRHVVAEVQACHPHRRIDLSVSVKTSVVCDAHRIEQLLSNLLANAVEHGAPRTPISVYVSGDDRTFEIKVVNQGPPIPKAMMARLFQPYFRGGQRGSAKGLGLGLYIASEIAKSHGGCLDVTSSPERTAFTFRMPIVQS